MKIPGFSAEASLYNGNVRYQVAAGTTFYDGLIQLALSDVTYADRSRSWLSFGNDVLNRCRWGYLSCEWKEIYYDPYQRKSYRVWVCLSHQICYW
ncbi:MAG: hypothetical protein HOP02_02080 [Methylococcaceae bacterium]|nr:hypothetical protein [Methylococcaceae bacterium]